MAGGLGRKRLTGHLFLLKDPREGAQGKFRAGLSRDWNLSSFLPSRRKWRQGRLSISHKWSLLWPLRVERFAVLLGEK